MTTNVCTVIKVTSNSRVNSQTDNPPSITITVLPPGGSAQNFARSVPIIDAPCLRRKRGKGGRWSALSPHLIKVE